jgi:hypothetical protein
MKYRIRLLTALAAFCFCTVPVRADQVDQLVKSMGGKSADALCRKTNAMQAIVSLRSFEGTLCKTPYIAALAEVVCAGPNTDSYNNSSCHKNAIIALNGRDPTEVLKEAVKNGDGKAKVLVCGRAGIPDAVKGACS